MPKREVVRIPFHKTELFAFSGDTPETAMVAMQPIVDGMGLDWKSQQKTMKNHPVIRDAVSTYTLRLPTDDRARKHTFMQVQMIRFWMGQINPNLVRAQLRSDLIVYQKECAQVLHAHFSGSTASAIGSRGSSLSQEDRQVIGGINKAVTRSELASVKHEQSRLAADVAKIMSIVGPTDRTRVTVTSHRPMLDILIGAGVTDKHGRRHLVTRCTKSLLIWLKNKQFPHPYFKERAYLFNVRAAAAWLDEQGKAIIAEHKACLARLAGQPELDLGRPQRRKRTITEPTGATA
jgi:hypothetical protein